MDVDLSEWISLVSTGIAAVALFVAFSAKADSKKSNELSTKSNDLAEGSNKFAREANKLSVKANSIAEEAKGFAAEANEISKRAEQRETEDHDVTWTHKWADDGVLHVINTGEDEALEAVVRLSAGGVSVSSERENVPGRGHIEVVHGRLRSEIRGNDAEHERQVRQHREAAAAAHMMGGFGVGMEPIPPGTWADIKIDVTWKTPLGGNREETLEKARVCF